jgi:hypothetical protein
MSDRSEKNSGARILYLPGVPRLDERPASGEVRGQVEPIIAEVRGLVGDVDSAILEVLIRDRVFDESQIEREPGSGRVFIKIADERIPLVAFMRRLYPNNATGHLPKYVS